MNRPADLVRLMRPHQWVKNIFVFTGLLFGHAWENLSTVVQVVAAAVGFCLVSSSVYLINDVADREADRKHPRNHQRPLAAGTVSVRAALLLAGLLLVAGFALEALASGLAVVLLGIYLLQNVGYSFGLKRIVILDVFMISIGFMLRILVGTSGVGIPPSKWLLLCGFTLTLLLGFAKRRAELGAAGDNSGREVLQRYSPALLDKMIGITAACVVMSYSLYTMSPETIQVHGTSNLIYTIPFVVYAIFRYLYLLHFRGVGADPSRDLVRDPHLILSGGAWIVVTALLLQ